MDTRERKLADLLVNYSVRVKPGDKVWINAVDVPVTMTEELISSVYRAGGYPLPNIWSERVERAVAEGASEESLGFLADLDSYRMSACDCFIGIRGIANVREMSTIPEKSSLFESLYSMPVHGQIRVPKTRWVVLRYPTEIMAMQANMGSREFEDYFYRVCTEVDYPKMQQAMLRAKEFLDRKDKVHIIAPGTDLTFSVRNLPWIPCAGSCNIPDGEIYSCPVRDSVNGTIRYNCASTYRGHRFTDISFRFRDGKIIEAHSDDDVLINRILDTDEGARYIGEFALGCNPQVSFPMDNILFDEKIRGSFHFTPGNSYDDCDNGNKSAVHWDLVQIQTPEAGGGEILMDDELVRKDGLFVHPALASLNSI